MADRQIINVGSTVDDGTGDLLRDAFNKVNTNFEALWEVTAVNSNVDISGDTIASTGDLTISPTDNLLIAGGTTINSASEDSDFIVNGNAISNVLFVDASTGRVGIRNNTPTAELDVTGNAKVSGTTTTQTLTVNGTSTIGADVSQIVNFNSRVGTSFEPYGNQTIGSLINRWQNGYFTNLDVSGVISGTFSGSIDPGTVLTNDVNNANVTTDTLEVSTSAEIETLLVRGNLAVQGTTTTIDSATIQVIDSLTFEGATDDDFEVVLTVTDPTADRTITLQDADGTLAFTSDIPTNVSELTNDAGYLTSYTETNDLTSAVTWANVPDANITSSSVVQHEANLTIAESQISDLQSYLTSVAFDDLTSTPTTLSGYGITDAVEADNIEGTVTGHLIPDTDDAYDLGDATHQFRSLYLTGATIYLAGNALSYNGSGLEINGTALATSTDIGDLATVATTGSYNDLIDTPSIPTALSQLTDDVGYLTSETDSQNLSLVGTDLSISNGNTISLGGLVPSNVSEFVNDAGYITDYTVTSDDVTAHEANLSITESQISDFGTYATVASLATVATTGSYNDLTDTTNVVTSTTVPTSSVGNSGDVAGLVAFDGSYIYYCKASYDGSTDIWKRVAWSVDTW